jgi:hypothetical protein
MRPSFGLFLAIAGLLFIAVTTLVPLPQAVAWRSTPLWCLICGDHGSIDVINNVLLFVPFAAGLRLLGIDARLVIALGAALSVGIELLQLTVIPGRDASLSDLLTNTSGSWFGTVLGTNLSRLLRPKPTLAFRLALAAGVIWLGIQATTALLLQPWAPNQGMRGAWNRSVYGRAPFDGQVVSVFLSGWPLRDAPESVSSDLVAKIREGRIHLELQLLSGQRKSLWSPIVELLGPRGAVLAIYAWNQDLVFLPPMRSTSLRLGRPWLRLPSALPSTPGVEVQVAAGEAGSTLWAEWTSRGRRYRAMQPLSPSFGWSLLTWFRYAYGPEVRLITMVWIVVWLAPVGYWAALAPGERRFRVIALLLLIAAGLALVPLATGYQSVHWSEWVAALAGVAVGWAGHRFVPYFEKRCDSPSIKESC